MTSTTSATTTPAVTGSAALFQLPDVGEGLTEAEIVTWRVRVGDSVEVNQPLVDIETAKSTVELPSPYAGIVLELLVAEGQTVPVGSAIIAIQAPHTPASDRNDPPGRAIPGERPEPPIPADTPRPLVGYGEAAAPAVRRRRSAAQTTFATTTPEPAVPVVEADIPAPRRRPVTKPPLRLLAKTLGVNLREVTASGSGGVITRTDIERAAAAHRTSPLTTPANALRTPDEIVRVPIKGVRKFTAAAMVSSAFTAPHATLFCATDVSATLALKDKLSQLPATANVRLTLLAFVARAFVSSLMQSPEANSKWNNDSQEILQFPHVHLGLAAATPRGLIVPNIKSADTMDLVTLARSIAGLTSAARAGTTTPEDQAGGTTTITNVGVFGIDGGTPLLNPGEATILAVGSVRRQPWVVNDENGERIEPRSIMQLALSIDHRVIDGQVGAEVLARTSQLLTDPDLFSVFTRATPLPPRT